MTNDDMELVRQFARTGGDQVFAALVTRHINLVYSAAWRQVRDPQLAEEVAQTVFLILARKAASLSPRTILPGWLFRTVRYVSSTALKQEARLCWREQEAFMDSATTVHEPDPLWEQLSPLLDEAMADLRDQDRDALVLRYIENKSLREVGEALGVNDQAAYKRITRSLEKVRGFFARRGVTLTTMAISGAMSSNSIQAAPAGLAASITTSATGAAAGGSTAPLLKGALKIMAWTKAKAVIIAGAAVFLAATATTVTVKQIEARRTYPWQVLRTPPTPEERLHPHSPFDNVPPQVRILPTKFPGRRGGGGTAVTDEGRDSKFIGIKDSFPTLIETAFQQTYPNRITYAADVPPGEFDFIANLPDGSPRAMQEEIQRKFGLAGRIETVETNVLLLKVKTPNSPELKQPSPGLGGTNIENGEIKAWKAGMNSLASTLETSFFKVPVLNETGLKGGFDFAVDWDANAHSLDNLKQALTEQLGLELVPAIRPVDILVIEKAKP